MELPEGCLEVFKEWKPEGSQADHGLENSGDALYPYENNGRPEWTRTIDLFRVKEAL
jgi:hypothetical protein